MAWLRAALLLLAARLAQGQAPETMARFTTWLKDNGAEISKAEIGQDPATGRRGVFAAADIEKGDIILRIPYKLIITENVLLKDHALQVCGEEGLKQFTQSSPQVMISTSLLFEWELGERSFFKPALDVLPRPEQYDTPSWWSEDDFKLLKGSALYSRVRSRKKEVDDMYRKYSRKCPAIGERFAVKDWRWAVEAVLSRVFGVKTKKRSSVTSSHGKNHLVVMVPFADMANHHENANTTWKFDDGMDSFIVTAKEAIPKGAEIYDSYGNKDSDSMLQNYGFIPEVPKDGNKPVSEQQGKAMTRLPMCVPPSLVDVGRGARRRELFKLGELPPCCEGDGLDDEACFRKVIDSESDMDSLFLVLGMPPSGSAETSHTQLAKILAHFRLLATRDDKQLECLAQEVPPSSTEVRSFAEWTTQCIEADCWPDATTTRCNNRLCPQLLPVSTDVESEALRLLKALVQAHLSQTRWVDDPDFEGISPGSSAWRRETVQRYLSTERNTLRWHAVLADFAPPLLGLKDRKALAEEVCEQASMQNKTKRSELRTFRGYIDTVIAPLHFLPWPEHDKPCSVVHTTHELTKTCLQQELSRGVDDMVEAFRKKHGYGEEQTSQEL